MIIIYNFLLFFKIHLCKHILIFTFTHSLILILIFNLNNSFRYGLILIYIFIIIFSFMYGLSLSFSFSFSFRYGIILIFSFSFSFSLVVWNGLAWDNFLKKIIFSKISLGKLYKKKFFFQILPGTTLQKKNTSFSKIDLGQLYKKTLNKKTCKTSLGETECLGNPYFTGCLGIQFFNSPLPLTQSVRPPMATYPSLCSTWWLTGRYATPEAARCFPTSWMPMNLFFAIASCHQHSTLTSQTCEGLHQLWALLRHLAALFVF